MPDSHSFDWAHPATWPWSVYFVIALFAGGAAQALWHWFLRARAKDWPITQGKIEHVSVAPGNGSPRAMLEYSYTIEGRFCSGRYQREFGTDDKADDFARDLEGKAVTVSYNPRDITKSTLTDDAIARLAGQRPDKPAEVQLASQTLSTPKWAKPLLGPLMALSLCGLVLSFWAHINALLGHEPTSPILLLSLTLGIFVVFIPAGRIATARVGNRESETAILSGVPDWARYMVYGFFVYAFVNPFYFFVLQPSLQGTRKEDSAIAWMAFSSLWMVFYSVAFAVFYAATLNTKPDAESSRNK